MEKQVIKRDGKRQSLDLKEIEDKIIKLCTQFDYEIDVSLVLDRVQQWLPEVVRTVEIDRLVTESANAIFLSTGNKVYTMFAGVLMLNNINKATLPFCDMVNKYSHKFVNKFVMFVRKHEDLLLAKHYLKLHNSDAKLR